MEIFGIVLLVLGMIGLMMSDTSDWPSLFCSALVAMAGMALLIVMGP